eukprot:gene9830-20447_t
MSNNQFNRSSAPPGESALIPNESDAVPHRELKMPRLADMIVSSKRETLEAAVLEQTSESQGNYFIPRELESATFTPAPEFVVSQDSEDQVMASFFQTHNIESEVVPHHSYKSYEPSYLVQHLVNSLLARDIAGFKYQFKPAKPIHPFEFYAQKALWMLGVLSTSSFDPVTRKLKRQITDANLNGQPLTILQLLVQEWREYICNLVSTGDVHSEWYSPDPDLDPRQYYQINLGGGRAYFKVPLGLRALNHPELLLSDYVIDYYYVEQALVYFIRNPPSRSQQIGVVDFLETNPEEVYSFETLLARGQGFRDTQSSRKGRIPKRTLPEDGAVTPVNKKKDTSKGKSSSKSSKSAGNHTPPVEVNIRSSVAEKSMLGPHTTTIEDDVRSMVSDNTRVSSGTGTRTNNGEFSVRFNMAAIKMTAAKFRPAQISDDPNPISSLFSFFSIPATSVEVGDLIVSTSDVMVDPVGPGDLGHFGLIFQRVQQVGARGELRAFELSPLWFVELDSLEDDEQREAVLGTPGKWVGPFVHVVIADAAFFDREQSSNVPQGFEIISTQLSRVDPNPPGSGSLQRGTGSMVFPPRLQTSSSFTQSQDSPNIPLPVTTQSVSSSVTMSTLVTEAPGGYRICGLFFRKSVKPEEAFKTIGFRRCVFSDSRVTEFTEAEGAPFLPHGTVISNLMSKYVEYTSSCDMNASDEEIVSQGFDPDYLCISQWPLVTQCPIFSIPELFNHFIRFNKECFGRDGVIGLQNFLVVGRELYPGWDAHLYNTVIQEALRNLSITFSICFGSQWEGSLDGVVRMVQNYRVKYHNLYHWDLISRALYKFFNVIGHDKSIEFPRDFPDGSLGNKSNPDLVKKFFVFLVQRNMSSASVEGCSKFMDTLRMQPTTSIGYMVSPPSHPAFQYSSKNNLLSKASIVGPGVSDNSKKNKRKDRKKISSKDRGTTNENSVTTSSDVKDKSITCMMDFVYHNQLRVSFVKGSIIPCRKGSSCPFAHHEEIASWPSEKIWDGLKGAPQFKPPKERCLSPPRSPSDSEGDVEYILSLPNMCGETVDTERKYSSVIDMDPVNLLNLLPGRYLSPPISPSDSEGELESFVVQPPMGDILSFSSPVTREYDPPPSPKKALPVVGESFRRGEDVEFIQDSYVSGTGLSSSEVCRAKVNSMFAVARDFFQGSDLTVELILELLNQCVKAEDLVYNNINAVEWAEDFHFPPSVADRDWKDLEEFSFNLSALVEHRHSLVRPQRFNRDRFNCWNDPEERDQLESLVDGMVIHHPPFPSFYPSGKPQALRKTYRDVAPAVNRMVFDLHKKGAVLILPTDKLIRAVPDLHYSVTSWATKKGKPQGRLIMDPSFSESGVKSLNSPQTKDLVKQAWGTIQHPTLIDLVDMILDMTDRYGMVDVALWKQDLSNAFGLLDVHPESARLVASSLGDNLTYLYLIGFFGWSGTPYAFDVITRTLRRRISREVEGRMTMYVDDILGCSRLANLRTDMETSANLARTLLGPNAMAADKEQWGRKLDMLGWSFDLDLGVVFIADHNFYKTFYGFFNVNTGSPVMFKDLEKLASWASRYVAIAPSMKPHVLGLYASLGSSYRGRGPVTLSEDAIQDILVWRCFLSAAWLQPRHFAREFESFRRKKVEFLVSFDASLSGLGIVIEPTIGTGKEEVIQVFPLPFDLANDPSYQNTVEFLAVLVATCHLVRNGRRGVGVLFKGDSRTALAWAADLSFRGTSVRKASILFAFIVSRFNIQVVDTIHIPGVDNDIPDAISRDLDVSKLGVRWRESFREGSILEIDESVMRILTLCSPKSSLNTNVDYISFWNEAMSEVLEW